MLILIAILLWLFGEDQSCKADYEDYMKNHIKKENDALQRLLDQEHARLMIEKQLAERNEYRRKITRNIAKDEHGRVVAQEIIEEV